MFKGISMKLDFSKLSLRKQLLLSIIITTIVVGSLLVFISREIIISGYEKLENQTVETNIQNIISVIDNNINVLDTIVANWAGWDDTYNFIGDLNPEYIESNLVDTTFQRIGVNVMLFIRTDGSIAYKKAYDVEAQKELPLNPELLELLKNDKQLIYHETIEAVKKGIIVVNNKSMVIASRPILTSEKEGPIAGCLIMGRFINLESLIIQTHLINSSAVSFHKIDSSEIPDDFKAQLLKKDNAGLFFSKPVDNNIIKGYTLIRDIQGQPGMVVELVMTRDIYQQGIITSNYLIFSLSVLALALAVIGLYIANKSILDPLHLIIDQMKEIGLDSYLSKRLKPSDSVEFSRLSDQFNSMMDSLERSQYLLKESEQHYSDLFMKMSEGVYRTTPQGDVISANPALINMLGFEGDDIYKIKVSDTFYINPRDRQIWQKQIEETGEIRGIELHLKRKDGQKIIVMENSWAVKDSTGKVMYYEGTLVDITQRKLAEEELIRRFKFEQVVMEISTSFVSAPSEKIDEVINISLSKIGDFAEVDRSYLFSISDDRLNINNTHEWCREGIDGAIHLNKDIPVRLISWSMEKLFNLENLAIDDINNMPPEAKSEKYIWDSQDIKSILLVPVQFEGNITGFLGFDSVRFLKKWQQSDIDILKIVGEIFGYALNRKKTDKELKYLSLHDSLTGLYNRSYFDEEVQRLNMGRITKVGVIVCDVDGLKLTNDALGHKAGDVLLKKTAQALKMNFRKEDVVTRIGGDEFAILLPNCDRVAVEKACNRLRESIEKINQEKFFLPLSISIGYASREETNISVDDLFKLADELMYQDKRSHIESIYPLIKQALKRISISDINHF